MVFTDCISYWGAGMDDYDMIQFKPHWVVVYLPLWKIWKSVGLIIPNSVWKVIKIHGSKPPTRYLLVLSCHILWSVCMKWLLCIPCFSSFCLKNISYSQYIYTNQITSIVGVQKKTSNNQTWLKGKFRHVLDDFPSYKARESCSNLDVNHSSKWESRKIPLDPIRMDFFTEIESYYLVQSQ